MDPLADRPVAPAPDVPGDAAFRKVRFGQAGPAWSRPARARRAAPGGANANLRTAA